MAEMHDLAAPYVLEALDAAERRAFEEHLETCAVCRAEVVELREATTLLAFAGSETPPPQVRSRLLAEIESTPQERPGTNVVSMGPRRALRISRWVPVAAAAVLALVLGVAALVARTGDAYDDVLAAADAVELDLTVTEGYTGLPPARAELAFSPGDERAAVAFAGLPAAPAGDTYQLWLIGDAGAMPAGLFTPDEDGEAIVAIEGTAARGLLVGITIEPGGGSPSPTGEVLFLAEL